MEALGINLGYLLVQIFNFAIMFLVLYAWVYRPLVHMLKERREKIAQGLEDARVASEARENAEKDAERILVDARAKAAQEVSEIKVQAEQQAKEIKAEAEADAAKTREEARQQASQERNQLLGEVRGQIAALAMAATQRMIGETLNEKRQRVLIQEFFSGVKSGKVIVLEGAKVSGQKAVVTSALPLTDEEIKAVEKDVIAQLGKGAEVEFKVDPNILGGLIVRVGDKVLDGSVAGQLEEMRQNLR